MFAQPQPKSVGVIRPKWRKRLLIITQNAALNLLTPLFNLAVSLLVIRTTSEALWGGVVSIMIVVQFGVHIAGWGNKDYLLRAFSQQPDQIIQLWQSSLYTRAALMFPVVGVLLLLDYPLEIRLLAFAWGCGLFFAQAFDVLIVYRRDFVFATVVEFISTVGVIMLLAVSSITLNFILALFAAQAWIKALVYAIRNSVFGEKFLFKFDITFVTLALPFFLLGFSGVLASRIDLYTVTALMTDADVGKYQVFINLMLYLQAISAFIIAPYTKNLYRMQDRSIFRVAVLLFSVGGLFSIFGVIWALLLISRLYGLTYPIEFAIFGAAFVLPVYGYSPLVYRLFKYHRQGTVVIVSFVGAGVNLALNLWLLPIIGLSAAILSSAVVQWGTLGFYVTDAYRQRERITIPVNT